MSLWGNIDQSFSAPKNTAEILNVGAGAANKQANNVALFNNATANTVENGVTTAIVLITPANIGSHPGAHTAGWNIQRTFTGGRAGRVTYEPIVSMRSGTEPGTADPNQMLLPVLGL